MMTWPNRITVLRILLLIPFLILLLNADEDPGLRYWALGVFALMALCDFLDGQLARRWNQRTKLGTILDPLADKLVLTASVVILTFPRWLGSDTAYHIPLWVTVTLLGKDVLILLGVLVVHVITNKTDLARPSLPGKAATALSFALVLATLLAPDLAQLPVSRAIGWGLQIIGGAAAVLAIVAFLGYVREGSRMLAAHSGTDKV